MKASQQKESRGRKRKVDFSTAAGWKYCSTEVLLSGEEPLSYSCGGGVFESSNHEKCTYAELEK